jgi:hypothetical protein
VVVVENHWFALPGNLPGFHVWLQPSETKEISIINHIALLPISKDTILKQIAYVFHSILSLQNIKIENKMIKHKAYITTQISDCSSRHTSERSIHRPSMLQQMAQGLGKLHTI